MKIDGLVLVDLGILVERTFIFCDVHIGIEEAMAKQGVLLPKFHLKDIVDKVSKVIAESGMKKFDRIVINGDIKHEFGRISDEEWRNTFKFLDYLGRYCDKIILVKGNHDSILGPIAERKKIEFVSNYRIGKILICHGDKILDDADLVGVETILIGHEHPAIELKDRAKVERFKCYLIGDWQGKRLIVQPSLNLITDGTPVNKGSLLSPFLKQDIGDFQVIIVGDELYDFGALKNYYL